MKRRCKGRILLAPTFHYVNGDEEKVDSLQNWIIELKQAKFKHIYFISTDNVWKKEETNLTGSFLWIPSISLEHVEMEQAQEMIKQQVSQIIDIFKHHWKNETNR